jgi:hypothetical protein
MKERNGDVLLISKCPLARNDVKERCEEVAPCTTYDFQKAWKEREEVFLTCIKQSTITKHKYSITASFYLLA